MVVFVRFNALASIVDVDVVLLELFQNVNVNGSWVNTDMSAGDL